MSERLNSNWSTEQELDPAAESRDTAFFTAESPQGHATESLQEDESSQEKLKKGIKVVVGGPPHSGKSVFIEALMENLDKDNTFSFSAAPDGEGPWLQRNYNDPDVAKLRQKGKFTDEFVEYSHNVIENWRGPLMIIDVGGRTSEENAKMIEGATHAIILAGDLSKVAEWREFFSGNNIEVIAKLHSHYHGDRDLSLENIGENSAVIGSVHHLERGEPAADRMTIRKLASFIDDLVDQNTAYQNSPEREHNGTMIDLVNFKADLPGQLIERQLPNGKNILRKRLSVAAIPEVYQKALDTYTGSPVYIDSESKIDRGWEAVALVCAFDDAGAEDIVIRGFEDDIELKKLPQSGEGSGLEWVVSGSEGGVVTVYAKAGLSTRIVKPSELSDITIPEVPTDSTVIISTAGPHWLRGSIALGYKDNVSAIAAFTPGEGSTVAWAKDKAMLGEVIS